MLLVVVAPEVGAGARLGSSDAILVCALDGAAEIEGCSECMDDGLVDRLGIVDTLGAPEGWLEGAVLIDG